MQYDFNWTMTFAKIPQYTLFSILMALFVIERFRTRIQKENLLPYCMLFMFSFIAYANGVKYGYGVNVKPFVLTCLCVFLTSRRLPVRLFEKLVVVVTVLLLVEYVMAYTHILPFDHLSRHGLIRPIGFLFFGLHDISYFMAFSYFAMGYTKLSGVFALVLGSYQTALAWVFMVYSKLNKFILVVFVIALVTMLSAVGHLSFELGNSMVSVILLTLEEAPIVYDCLVFGCSVNVNDDDIFGSFVQYSDVGYFRVLYQFGILWILCLFYILRKYNKPLLFANVVLWLHYPVNLGILGFVFFIWILQYVKYKESTKSHYHAMNDLPVSVA